MIKQDTLENQVKIVYLGIGSNLGNKQQNIENTKAKINECGIKIIKCSRNYESLSYPNTKDPTFINVVLKVETYLSPFQLLRMCNNIEMKLGRKRFKKNAPRTCDIDIIDYNQQIMKYVKSKKLILPHPEMSKRNFVLLPLYEISRNWFHPKKKIDIKKLINSLNVKDLRTIKQI